MIKQILFIIAAILLFSCQKEIDSSELSLISIHSDKTSITIGSEERATITVVLTDYKPGTIIDLTFQGGTINGQSSTAKFSLFNDSLELEYLPGTTAGTFYITAPINGTEHTSVVEIQLLSSDPLLPVDSVLNLNLGQTGTFYADGISTVDVIATVTGHEATALTFTTTKGTFSNGNTSIVVPIYSGQAMTSLTLSSESVAHVVTANLTTPNYAKSITINTAPSLPESIVLTANSSVVDSSAVSESQTNIKFTAFLNKALGKVSIGQSVNAVAYQMPGGVQTFYGSFYDHPLESDLNEKVTCHFFTSPGLNKNLPLFIVFSTNGVSGIVSDTLVLSVE